MNKNNQNACLSFTTYDDENNTNKLVYVPLFLDQVTFELILAFGNDCTNRQVFAYDIKESDDEFWTKTWDRLSKDGDEE